MITRISGLDKGGKQIFKIDKKEMALYEKAEEELNKRYTFCDKEGHKEPKKSANTCNYCHRRLEYYIPSKSIMKEREKLPWYKQPFDAPVLFELNKESKENQKTNDYDQGIDILKEEIRNNKKSLLKKLFP